MNEKLFREMQDAGRVLVDVARMDEDGATLEGATGDILDLHSEYIRPLGGIAYSLEATPAGPELLVRGSLRATLEAECSRCNRTFSFDVSVDGFAESFELDPAAEFLDITDAIREAVILEIPAFPVHDPGCKGLCAQCGADLNDGPCGCAAKGSDSRWGALDGLGV